MTASSISRIGMPFRMGYTRRHSVHVQTLSSRVCENPQLARKAQLLVANFGDFLTLFDKPQRDAFAMLILRLHHYGDLGNEIFWGLWLLPLRPLGVQVALPAPC